MTIQTLYLSGEPGCPAGTTSWCILG
jgi:hypothetical protein